jgi:hypothetical protein
MRVTLQWKGWYRAALPRAFELKGVGDLKSRLAIIPGHGCIDNLCARALPPADHVDDSQLREECFP